MTSLESMGVQVERSFQSSNTTLSAGAVDVSLASKELTRCVVTLPTDCGIKASFRKESWGDTLVKLFKREIHTGDAAFDKLVYITTDTPEATKALLAKDDVRNAIGLTIETGGPIEIDGTRVVAHTVGHDSADDASVVTLVAALLG